VVWSWATPRNAAVRHQRARYAVWPDTSQTTRRGIRRHEATRTVLDSDVYTSIHIYLYIFMYTYLYIFMYTYTYTYININIWIYIYIYIYGYTYLYEYVDMVGTSPTPRSAVTRHQRVRDAVWSGSSQTTRRAIPTHETTRIVIDIDVHSCVCNFFFEIIVFVRI